jgi:hypothetical protein
MANKFAARHYDVLAKMLAEIRANHPVNDAGEEVGYGLALIDIEHDMIAIFGAGNPRFDAQRFADAAQPRSSRRVWKLRDEDSKRILCDCGAAAKLGRTADGGAPYIYECEQCDPFAK